jgi:hypothetical protein
MPKTVYRQLRSVRRTPRPRGVSSSGMSGAFDSLLAKLGLASQQLKASRKRR